MYDRTTKRRYFAWTSMKLLFLTDSRGFGLDRYIAAHNVFEDCLCTVISKGGATLAHYLHEIDHLKQDFDLIIVAAGICDFTRKDKSCNIISYQSDPEKLDAIAQCLDTFRCKLGQKLIQSTIIPAQIEKHNSKAKQNPFDSEQQKAQQKLLEKDIDNINTQIVGANKGNDLEAIRLHELTQRRQLKRTGQNGKKLKRHKVHLSRTL